MTRPPLRLSLLGLVNVYLVPEKDGLTLVDTGLPPLSPSILRAATHLRRPLTHIVLTHGHYDHVGGVDALLRAFPDAKFLMPRADEPFLAQAGVQSRPDAFLEAGQRVGSLHVLPAPGHSPGQVAFFDGRDGTLYTGDSFVSFGGLHSVTEVSWPFVLPTLATWNQDVALDTARALGALQDVRWVAPGHGPAVRNSGEVLAGAAARAARQGVPSGAQRRLLDRLARLMGVRQLAP